MPGIYARSRNGQILSPSRKKSPKVNDFISTGIATPTQMTVIPRNELIKKSEIPVQYHRILQESAGHCRSKRESACVRKLLEAVRLSTINVDQLQTNEEDSTIDNLLTSPSQGAVLKRLYADSPRGLASHSLSDTSQQSATVQDEDPKVENNSDIPSYGKFACMIRNEVASASSDQLAIAEEGLNSPILANKELEEATILLRSDPIKNYMNKEEVCSKNTDQETIDLPQPRVSAETSSDKKEEEFMPAVQVPPLRPAHPLFSSDSFALGRVTLKKVKWVDIQDTSGPKLKSSLTTSSEFSEEVLTNKLLNQLETWLLEQTNTFSVNVGSVQPDSLHASLGVGRFAKVLVADLLPRDSSHVSPTTTALKISTFANAPSDITEVCSAPPRGVLLSWEREMKALIALSHIKSDRLIKILGACLKPRPMIALELSTEGNLTHFINHKRLDQEVNIHEFKEVSPSLRLKLAQDCCRGIAAMHKAGWSHLDLKPHNVMISKSTDSTCDFIAKIGDFGSSIDFKSLQDACFEKSAIYKDLEANAWALLRSGVGTSGWTAPELLAAVDTANDDITNTFELTELAMPPSLDALHTEADCFSFGVILWYCLFQDVSHHIDSLNSISNPLIGLNSSECRVALENGVKLPWPQHNDVKTSHIGRILDRLISLNAADRPTMAAVDTEIELLRVQKGLWLEDSSFNE